MKIYDEAFINSLDDSLNFTSISDFKWSINAGTEVEFYWMGKSYSIFAKVQETPDSPVRMYIGESASEIGKFCDMADELLEYIVAGQPLRDIITKVQVIDRTI